MHDVISVGSATVDTFIETDSEYFKGKWYSFPVGAKILAKSVYISSGGSATNTAVGFSRFGLKTAAICCIGVGGNSRRIIEELRQEKVTTGLIERNSSQRTGFSIILNAKHHDRTIIAFKGSNDLLCNECLDNKMALRTRWMYFGSLMGEAYQTMKQLVKAAHAHGVAIAFNPSLYLAKKGKKYLKGILERCDIVILNKEETQALLNKKDMRKCLLEFFEIGVKKIIITDGENGVHAYDGRQFFVLKPRIARIVESTGAGDAFGCGFVGAIAKGKSMEEALRYGQANAESVIGYVGAKKGLLRWKEAQQHIKDEKIKVKVC